MEHTHEETKIIQNFVKTNNDRELTVNDIAMFIKLTFGTTWNTNDDRTREYLEQFIKVPS